MRSTVSLVAVILLFGDCVVHSAAVKTQPTVTKGIQQTVCLLFFPICRRAASGNDGDGLFGAAIDVTGY